MVKQVNGSQTINTSDLIKKADYDTKIRDIKKKIPDHDKYITNKYFNTFSTIFNKKLKREKIATNNDLNIDEI